MPAPAVSTRDSRRATQVTLRVVVLLSAILTIVFAVSLVKDRGIAALQQSRKRVTALRSDIEKLEAENARLRSQIDSVKKSTYAVERIAREDLSMSRKGEVVYMLPKQR